MPLLEWWVGQCNKNLCNVTVSNICLPLSIIVTRHDYQFPKISQLHQAVAHLWLLLDQTWGGLYRMRRTSCDWHALCTLFVGQLRFLQILVIDHDAVDDGLYKLASLYDQWCVFVILVISLAMWGCFLWYQRFFLCFDPV